MNGYLFDELLGKPFTTVVPLCILIINHSKRESQILL